MPWQNDPEKRRRDARVYGPEYKRNRAIAWRRADGRCEWLIDGRRCRSADRCEVDHIVPTTQGGGPGHENLRVLCKPHHNAKTAQEGGGYRSRRGKSGEGDPPVQERTKW
jgi:5-methylcytosine-specific restriction endonuclease McrA